MTTMTNRCTAPVLTSNAFVQASGPVAVVFGVALQEKSAPQHSVVRGLACVARDRLVLHGAIYFAGLRIGVCCCDRSVTSIVV